MTSESFNHLLLGGAILHDRIATSEDKEAQLNLENNQGTHSTQDTQQNG